MSSQPQLLKSNKLPKGKKPTFIRIGDRDFIDVGAGPFSEDQKAKLLRRQEREYAPVKDAKAEPRAATAAEMRRKNRGGTPPRAKRPDKKPRKRAKKKKARRKKARDKKR